MAMDYGTHYLVEYAGCDPAAIRFVKDVEPLLLHAAKKSDATILNYFFHQFKPEGVTGIILISESHFAIHTWPETGFVALDILTCGKMDARMAINELEVRLKAKCVQIRKIQRGIDDKK